MVTVKTYDGEVIYPKGTDIRFPRKDPWVLKVVNRDGKTIAVHKNWESVSIDGVSVGSPQNFTIAKDGYISALLRKCIECP